MYKILLRNVVTGKKDWWSHCYLNGKLERNKVILWQSPEDKDIQRYKIVAWQWEGFDKYIHPKHKTITNFALDTLLDLDIPDEWRKQLKEYAKNPK